MMMKMMMMMRRRRRRRRSDDDERCIFRMLKVCWVRQKRRGASFNIAKNKLD